MGEEGMEAPVPNLMDLEKLAAGMKMSATTQAVGEEEGDIRPAFGNIEATTMAVGEEGDEPLPPGIGVSTTMAIGEEDTNLRPPSNPLTRAVPENGGDPFPPSTTPMPPPGIPMRPGPGVGVAQQVPQPQMPQPPEFDKAAFGKFYQGLDDSQRGLIDSLQQSIGYSHQRQMQEMQQQRFNPMMGGIMGMAPQQMRGYMPMMQSPMMGGYMPMMQSPMMGGYMPQQMYGGNPYMGGMMGMAPPMMQQMAMMPQHIMMQGGYMPQQQMMQNRWMNSQGGFGQMQQANYGGQVAQPNTQQAIYGQPQQASPFGGAMRGYYA